MLVIYLLTVIAVGVLLLSDIGKRILFWLVIVSLIGGVLYLLFWIVAFGVALLLNKETGGLIVIIFGWVGVIGGIIIWIREISLNYKKGDYSFKNIKNGLKNQLKEEWKNKNITIVEWSLMIVAVLIVVVLPLIIIWLTGG